MKTFFIILALIYASSTDLHAQNLTDYVNPFLGTTTLWDKADLHYERNRKTRTWGGETFPGASLPNAMVQLSPVTQYHSGSGYQYEDKTICGFAHTNKGHWNLLHVPFMPVASRRINVDNFASTFSHDNEETHPGYYRVHLDDYDIDVELTSTLRCGYHRYTFNRITVASPARNFIIERHGKGRKITDITSGGKKIKGYLVNDADFRAGKTLVVTTK